MKTRRRIYPWDIAISLLWLSVMFTHFLLPAFGYDSRTLSASLSHLFHVSVTTFCPDKEHSRLQVAVQGFDRPEDCCLEADAAPCQVAARILETVCSITLAAQDGKQVAKCKGRLRRISARSPCGGLLLN